MQRLLLLLLAFASLTLGAEEIKLPAELSAYEASIERTLIKETSAAKPDQKMIKVTVASGSTATVLKQATLELPSGSNVTDAAKLWTSMHRELLIGWAQGLVVVRRKTGDKVERVAWSMREARTQAPKFTLQNGDFLIALEYADY